MDRAGIDVHYAKRKAVFVKERQKLKRIVPTTCNNCEKNVAIPVTAGSCKNNIMVSILPPVELISRSCENNDWLSISHSVQSTSGRSKNNVVDSILPPFPLASSSCENNDVVSISLPVQSISGSCENHGVVSILPPVQSTSRSCENNGVVSVLPTVTKISSMTLSDCNDDQKKRSKGKENCIFRSILLLALMVGVPVTPSMLFPVRKRLIHFLKIWNGSVFYIRTILLIMECFYNHCFWTSHAQRYSIHGSCLSGYIIMVIFLAKRHEVDIALREMTRLSSELHMRGLYPLLRLYEFVCLLFCITYFSLGSYTMWTTMWDSSFKKIVHASQLSENSAFSYFFAWMVNVAEALTFHIGAVTLFTTTVLCGRSYLVSGEFVRQFAKQLASELSDVSLGSIPTSQYLRLFKRIFQCVGAVDDAFSICALVIYVDVINNYYAVLSTLLSGQQKYDSVEVMTLLGVVTLGATLKFLYLTLSGDFLRMRHFALMHDLVEMSDSVVRNSSEVGILRFTIITANIRTVEIQVTGMGYFKITRLIIPSALSALITYGFTIYQIGAIKDLD